MSELPSWEELKERASASHKLAKMALDSGDEYLLPNALENMHFAVEISMKAAIRKMVVLSGMGPEGHNLERLSKAPFGDSKTTLRSMAIKQTMRWVLTNGLSAWSVDCRYKSMESMKDKISFINDYERLYLWIKPAYYNNSDGV
ncbi:MAG: hypothetical protein IPM97_04670 [Bdellovibrionaceae bacterium]|nr:hypothetical protein [Pseudobdellovibrionaceae bacterium]